MLTLRQRGKTGNYYIRGSVSLGHQTFNVAEFSTRTCDEAAARHLMCQYEQGKRHELMFGPVVQTLGVTISDTFEAYLQKPDKPNTSDICRVGIMNDEIGTMSLKDPLAAWKRFREAYLLGHAPAGQDRYRSVLQASINVYNASFGIPPVKIPTIAFNNERVRFLSRNDRDHLINSYADHVKPIAAMLAFQGCRTQECLQVQWGNAGVDLERNQIYFGRTKNGIPRTVPIHPRVRDVVYEIWLKREKPKSGHVFLNRLGNPYTDTRDSRIQGGNPLQSAHETACKRACIENFTVHDWRHHWASTAVMAGIDLITIMKLGGWKSLRMVNRYAAVDAQHMAAMVAKIW